MSHVESARLQSSHKAISYTHSERLHSIGLAIPNQRYAKYWTMLTESKWDTVMDLHGIIKTKKYMGGDSICITNWVLCKPRILRNLSSFILSLPKMLSVYRLGFSIPLLSANDITLIFICIHFFFFENYRNKT